jgi:hypothetical protein
MVSVVFSYSASVIMVSVAFSYSTRYLGAERRVV